MERYVGTVVRGIRTPIIKEGDDLASIVVASLMRAQEGEGFEFRDKDIVAITEAVVSIADGNYVRVITESGIIGFALWLALQIIIIIHMDKNNKLNTTVRFGMYSLLLGAIFIDVFEASKVMMAFYFILGMAYKENKNNEERKSKKSTIKNVICCKQNETIKLRIFICYRFLGNNINKRVIAYLANQSFYIVNFYV